MLDPTELEKVAFHNSIHDMGMCTCPCMEALLKVSKALQKEREMQIKVARQSPDLLAALILGAETVREAENGIDQDS